MKTALLRAIDVRVARVRPQEERSSSPQYVFAIRPTTQSRQQSECLAPHRQDLDHVSSRPETSAAPAVHEVAHTYSECRALYQELQHLTDCKDLRACCCALGSCPFWSLFAVLARVQFPKKTLFNHQSKHVFSQRSHALDAFFTTVLTALRTSYRGRHFRELEAPYRGGNVCKVLLTLGLFLELDREDVARRLLAGGERLACKMNLQGWQTDRANLYFQSEDKKKYRRKSVEMELRPSLAMSDDDDGKDPATTRLSRAITKAAVAVGTAGAVAATCWLLGRILETGGRKRMEVGSTGRVESPDFICERRFKAPPPLQQQRRTIAEDSFAHLPLVSECNELEEDKGYTGAGYTPEHDVCMLSVSVETLVAPVRKEVNGPFLSKVNGCRLCKAAAEWSDTSGAFDDAVSADSRSLSFSETDSSSGDSVYTATNSDECECEKEVGVRLEITGASKLDPGRPRQLSRTESWLYVRL
ncbi:hypothetical protein BBJ28_00007958 [Nothophytophthora sp. Chile5]|nr:hypothetical protein BBJ28_00007958 [Nothophytophthora sp. Chile5]